MLGHSMPWRVLLDTTEPTGAFGTMPQLTLTPLVKRKARHNANQSANPTHLRGSARQCKSMSRKTEEVQIKVSSREMIKEFA